MKPAPTFPIAHAPELFDLAAKARDLALQCRQSQVVARPAQGQHASQPLGLGKSQCGFGEPLLLVCFAWIHS